MGIKGIRIQMTHGQYWFLWGTRQLASAVLLLASGAMAFVLLAPFF